jgi:hypothetical protein
VAKSIDDQQITTAMTHIDPDDQALLHALELDWRRMCGNAMTPTHVGLAPVKLDAALPHAFVLRRIEPGMARFRIAGQRLHDLLHMDPRGMSFGAFFTEAARDTALELLDAAFTLPAILAIPLIAPRRFGLAPVRGTALLLPMRDAAGDVTRMLGALVTSGSVPRRGVRFDIDHDVAMRCEELTGHFPDRRTGSRALSAASDQTATTPQTPSSARTAPASGLRLVVDNTR